MLGRKKLDFQRSMILMIKAARQTTYVALGALTCIYEHAPNVALSLMLTSHVYQKCNGSVTKALPGTPASSPMRHSIRILPRAIATIITIARVATTALPCKTKSSAIWYSTRFLPRPVALIVLFVSFV